MSIRLHGTTPTPIREAGAEPEPSDETISIDDAAKRLGISPNTCRRWIKADMADGGRRVPGGRCLDTKYVIVRAVFERALRHGIEPEPRPVAQGPDVIAVLEAVIAELRKSA